MWRLLTSLLLFALLGSPVAAKTLTGLQRWEGTVELAETIRVSPGAVLEIAAGTRIKVTDSQAKLLVRGRLLVSGSEAAPVLFAAPEGWQGIEFVEAEPGSRIEAARFADCENGVVLYASSPVLRSNRFERCKIAVHLQREAKPVLEENLFQGNQFGVKVSMRSEPQIRANRFAGNRQAAVEVGNSSGGLVEDNLFRDNNLGVGVQRSFNGVLRGNRFEQNQVGLYCYQSRNTPQIEANLFRDNQVAVSALSFAYPVLRNNRFLHNGLALRNDQFGSARVEHNLFRGNETAIYNNRKSDPKVRWNRFEENGLVLFIDYSSYPQVKQNNFLGNRKVAQLGSFQSADWEQRAGSRSLVMQQAEQRQSRNPLLEQAPTDFSDQVDLSGNWWGEDTALLQTAGTDANLPLLDDRRDTPQVSYPGYGDQKYRLDLIRYAPWLEQSVAAAGPKEAP